MVRCRSSAAICGHIIGPASGSISEPTAQGCSSNSYCIADDRARKGERRQLAGRFGQDTAQPKSERQRTGTEQKRDPPSVRVQRLACHGDGEYFSDQRSAPFLSLRMTSTTLADFGD